MSRYWWSRSARSLSKARRERAAAAEAQRRKCLQDLTLQQLEERVLLAVSATLNPSTGVLDVQLGGAGDAATVTGGGASLTVTDGHGAQIGQFGAASVHGLDVTGTGQANEALTLAGSVVLSQALSVADVSTASLTGTYSVASADLSAGAIALQGGILSSRQVVSGANPLTAASTGNSGSLTLNAPTIDLTAGAALLANVESGSSFTPGNIMLTASDTETGTTSASQSEIHVTDSKVLGGQVTLQSTSNLNVNTSGNGALGANLAMINASTSASVTIDGQSTIAGSGDVTIDSVSSAQVSASAPANGAGALGVDAGVATDTLTTSSMTQVAGQAQVSAGGILNIESANTTNATTTSDGTAGGPVAAGGTAAYAKVSATSQADLGGTASASGNQINITSTSTTSTSTTARSTAGGASQNDSSTAGLLNQYNAQTSGGKVGVAGALAITDLTRSSQAFVGSTGQVSSPNAINVSSTSTTSDANVADGRATTGNVGVGVAVAIDLVHATNEASIAGNAQLAAPSIAVQALTPGSNTYGAQATSGAGGTKVGVAGRWP